MTDAEKGLQSSAEEVIRRVLLAAIPPGVVPPFREIESAKFTGAGRQRKAHAEVILFDGQSGAVEASPWAFGWSYRWMRLDGGAFEWTGEAWKRCPPIAVQPTQGILPLLGES